MNKLLWLCGIIAFAVVSCTEGNRGSIKEKDTLSTYDSVLIGRDPGFSSRLTADDWMLYSHPLKTIFQHKACTDKLYADSFYKVQKNSHSSFEVICCRS